MKNYKYIGLFLLALGFISCEDSSDFEPIPEEVVAEVPLTANGLDFSKYVSIGASFTAGFTDGALFIAAQENSFPNILASKFQMANGSDFNQPLMGDNIGYHCQPNSPLPFINLASQKASINLYHSGIYAKKELHDWFVAEYPKYAKRKLDMGKSCIRFKKLDDIPFELIGELCKKLTVDEWITIYESAIKK